MDRDSKLTVTQVVDVDPLPKPDELFACLTGGQHFTKLDLSHALQPVNLGGRFRKFVTINTHKGLFCYTRLPFGVASAPVIFQKPWTKFCKGTRIDLLYG